MYRPGGPRRALDVTWRADSRGSRHIDHLERQIRQIAPTGSKMNPTSGLPCHPGQCLDAMIDSHRGCPDSARRGGWCPHPRSSDTYQILTGADGWTPLKGLECGPGRGPMSRGRRRSPVQRVADTDRWVAASQTGVTVDAIAAQAGAGAATVSMATSQYGASPRQ